MRPGYPRRAEASGWLRGQAAAGAIVWVYRSWRPGTWAFGNVRPGLKCRRFLAALRFCRKRPIFLGEMSAISGTTGSITGASLTPQEQADSALFGGSATNSVSPYVTPQDEVDTELFGGSVAGALANDETPAEAADAALVSVSGGATNSVYSDLEAGVPANLTAASALVSNLAGEVGQQGGIAASAYSLLSAASTLKLTTP